MVGVLGPSSHSSELLYYFSIIGLSNGFGYIRTFLNLFFLDILLIILGEICGSQQLTVISSKEVVEGVILLYSLEN